MAAPVDFSVALSSALHSGVIISLVRRQAKRASMLDRAGAAGIGDLVTVFDAVDGTAIDPEWLRENGFALYTKWKIAGHPSRFFSRDLKWGEIGCAISHWRTWEDCVRRAAESGDERPMLVLEDDVTFPDDFVATLVRVLAAAERAPALHFVAKPDLIYLLRKPIGRMPPGVISHEVPIDAHRHLIFNPPASAKTGAYVLYPRGARKLVASSFRTNLVPVDDFLPTIAAGHPLRPDLDQLFGVALPPALGVAGGEARSASAPYLIAYAVGPDLVVERKMSISDTENSSEVAPAARAQSNGDGSSCERCPPSIGSETAGVDSACR